VRVVAFALGAFGFSVLVALAVGRFLAGVNVEQDTLGGMGGGWCSMGGKEPPTPAHQHINTRTHVAHTCRSDCT